MPLDVNFWQISQYLAATVWTAAALFAAENLVARYVLDVLRSSNSVLGLILNTHDRTVAGLDVIFLSLCIDLGFVVVFIAKIGLQTFHGQQQLVFSWLVLFLIKLVAVLFLIGWTARIVLAETRGKTALHDALVLSIGGGKLAYRYVAPEWVLTRLKSTVLIRQRTFFGAIGLFMLFCTFVLLGTTYTDLP